MSKGLDRTFLHYGIRTEDLNLIQELCIQHDLDAEWVKEEILKAYHEKKVDAIEISDSDTEKVVNSAIQKLVNKKQL
ncbi:MAG: hypothetical protein HUJ83_08910 [Veillonella sp.]|nr:hypothetical protein [Veillonella sp.]